jgi:hypothetical protein
VHGRVVSLLERTWERLEMGDGSLSERGLCVPSLVFSFGIPFSQHGSTWGSRLNVIHGQPHVAVVQ